MAVERAVFGDRPAELTTAEREQVVKRLNRLGWSDARIAEHLDIGRSGVQRIRDRRGIPAVPVERRTAVAA
jgi:DNA-binding NarL/FixJ family response regulator